MSILKNLELYIVCHNKESFDLFHSINADAPNLLLFKFILVGEHLEFPDWLPKERSVVANLLPDNIEKHTTLLTYTAWYAILKNNIAKTDYVGIFEYDCEFSKDIGLLDLKQNTIIGFVRRTLPDDCFLEGTPKFQELLKEANVEQLFDKEFWCPTSNYIISVSFLQRFIEWFHNFLPKLFIIKNHPHFHERAISVYAFRNDVDVYFADGYLTHGELYSHGIDYDDK